MQATKIPISVLHCPPVWGFIGTKKYIDVSHTAYHCKSENHGHLDNIDSTVDGLANQKNHKYLYSALMQFTSDDLVNAVNNNDEVRKNIGRENDHIVSRYFK